MTKDNIWWSETNFRFWQLFFQCKSKTASRLTTISVPKKVKHYETSKSPLNICKYKRIKDWKLQNRCHICSGKNCWNGDILTFAYQIVDVWCQGFLLSFLFFAALISIPLLPLHPYFLWRYYYFWQKGAIISNAYPRTSTTIFYLIWILRFFWFLPNYVVS